MKGNLLIIDDEQTLASNLKLMLKKYADDIYVAFNGKDGLRLLEEKEIHCVICDIFMPGLTGLEVIKTIRDLGDKTPFIFFTAYGVDELKTEASQFERTVFLTKPDIREIINIITPMLQIGLAKGACTP